MSGEFVDYRTAPGFWFYLELLIAEDICRFPLYSAKYSDFLIADKDILSVFDRGLRAYRVLYNRELMENMNG